MFTSLILVCIPCFDSTTIFNNCIKNLDNEDWYIREQATNTLNLLMERNPNLYGPLLPTVRSLQEDNRLEADRRLHNIRCTYHHYKAVTWKPTTVPVWPCIDVLQFSGIDYRDNSELLYKYIYWDYEQRARKNLLLNKKLTEDDKSAPYYKTYREATHLLVIDLLENNYMTKDEVDMLLAWMWDNEVKVIYSNKDDFINMKKSLIWTDGYLHPSKMSIPIRPIQVEIVPTNIH